MYPGGGGIKKTIMRSTQVVVSSLFVMKYRPVMYENCKRPFIRMEEGGGALITEIVFCIYI